jgi:hypothetical protein
MILKLAPDIREILDRPFVGQGGHQSLGRHLKRQVFHVNGTDYLRLDAVSLERLRRYASQYGDGGWQGRWRAILDYVELTPTPVEAVLNDRKVA